jgi:membrane associated rhomboid family serine protease
MSGGLDLQAGARGRRYTGPRVIPLHDDIRTRRFPAVTAALIAANVAVFVVQLTLPRWGITPKGWYYLLGARPFELSHGTNVPPFGWFPWWVTLFTSMFVHGGWLHLIFNMLYLWIFGNNVEDAMTRPRFVAFYFICGMAATAAQVLVAPDSAVPLIGASGAIAGVLGGYLVLFPRARVLTVVPLIFIFPVFEVPAWILLVIWFVLQGIGGARSWGSGEAGVAFFAHLGGFVAGLLLVLLFARRRPARAGRRPVRARRRV